MSELIELSPALGQKIVAVFESLEETPALLPTQYIRAIRTRLRTTEEEPITMPKADLVSIAHGFAQTDHPEARAVVRQLATVTETQERFSSVLEE